MIFKEFNPLIYPRLLWVVVDPDIEELKSIFSEIDLDTTSDAQVHHICNKENKGGILLIFQSKKSLTTSIITHESIHAAMDILEYIDFKLDYDNQEPLTYLAGWIADCVYRVKNEIQKKEKLWKIK